MTVSERRERGRALRKQVPRSGHGEWVAAADRADPVAVLEAQNEQRLQQLVPVRHGRMMVSPFTFYRGGAAILAADLATTPTTELSVQLCGDAHLSNFGFYGSPERALVFDCNDFDETLPGPWEWDIKRLAASFFIAGRFNGLTDKACRKLARRVVRRYRKSMTRLAGMRTMDIWYEMVEAKRMFQTVENSETRKAGKREMTKAMRKDSVHALDKLAEEVDGEYRIRHEPPLIIRVSEVRDPASREDIRDRLSKSYEEYLASVPDHVEHVLRHFRPVDFAVKVVGVGSVGTRSFITLLRGRDSNDPLFLQTKEATTSVLEEVLPASRYPQSGQRVVEGQRLMEKVSDVFLGYFTSA